LFSAAILVALAVSGCASFNPKLGPISVTDPNPPNEALASVVAGAKANVTVTVIGDQPDLGVDWLLSCGGTPNPALESAAVACGSLNPAHVGSTLNMTYAAPAYIPAGNTVTLTARVTSDPSVTESVTLAIVSPPVTMKWTNGFVPPSQMAASGSQAFAADVTNDEANGVNWSVNCSNTAGSNPCGSFNPANPTLTADGAPTVYTAPAVSSAGGVTITATSAYDSTKSLSATIQIMPISVAVTVSPSNTVPAETTATLTATVSWDALNGGVSWAAPSCGTASCGSITPIGCAAGVAPNYAAVCTATYSAPAAIPSGATTLPVTVTATSLDAPASDATGSGSAAITVGPPPPITVSVASANSSVQLNGMTTLTATITNDYQNLGVNWSLPACGSGAAPSGCVAPGSCSQPGATASYTCTASYTAPSVIPSPDPVTVTASSIYCAQNQNSQQCTGNANSGGSANMNIVPAISVVISGPSLITAGTGASFTAAVTGDGTNAGVDWNCSLENCGQYFSTAHTASGASVTFTSPLKSPATSVIITATSTASETAPPLFPGPNVQPGAPGSADPILVTITPVPYIAFVPFPPSELPASALGATNPPLASMIAISANDTSNEGVDWSVCSTAATCGAFLVSAGAPATLNAAAIQPVYSSTIHAASGQAVSYLAPTQVPSTNSGAVTITAASHVTPSVSLTQQITITADLTGTAFSGTVMAGNLPVAGASVQLYAASSSGYGTQALPLVISNGASSVSTGSNGGFTIPSGYTCQSQNTLLYLVATGGTVQGQSAPNAQLGLMTALGPCSNLNSTAPVIVNEVTTVATAWALAPFTGTGGTNFQDYQYIGSSSANYSNGLANAFATVNNLVDITSGQSWEYTPAGGLFSPPNPVGNSYQVVNGLVPQAEINTLADAIDTCAASTGGAPGDGSPCDNFFYAADVNPVGGIVSAQNEPAEILSAVLEVAAYPGKLGGCSACLNVSSSGVPLYRLLPAQGYPFSPILSGAPSDWTIALIFTGGGLEGVKRAKANSSSIAVDITGNLWIANRSVSSVSELSNLGVALSPYATGYTTAASGGGFTGAGITQPTQIAIDPYGNPWLLNGDGSLSEGTQASCTATFPNPFCGPGSYPYAGGTGNTPVSMVIDGIGNLWVADSGAPGDVAEYAGFDSCKGGAACVTGDIQVATGALIGDYTSLTEANDPLDTAPANPQTIGQDGKGNVWVLDQGNYAAIELSDANGTLELVDHGFQEVNNGIYSNPVLASGVSAPLQWGDTLAFDKSGDIFIPDDVNGKQLYELYACGTGCTAGLAPSSPVNFGTIDPNGVDTPITIDGSGNIWLMSNPYTYSAGGVSASIPSALVEVTASGGLVNNNSSNPNYGYVNPLSLNNSPTSITADASGNIWMLFSSGASVTLPSGETVNGGPITEFVGVATPVSTPLALGKPGTKP
jgi:hypothetical protein